MIPEQIKLICKDNTHLLDIPEVKGIIEFYEKLLDNKNKTSYQLMYVGVLEEIIQLKKTYNNTKEENRTIKSEHERLQKENLIQKQMITDLSLMNKKQHHSHIQKIRQKHKEYTKLKKKYKKLKQETKQVYVDVNGTSYCKDFIDKMSEIVK
jgi:uncharacterized protein YecE (DUF72 family)